MCDVCICVYVCIHMICNNLLSAASRWACSNSKEISFSAFLWKSSPSLRTSRSEVNTPSYRPESRALLLSLVLSPTYIPIDWSTSVTNLNLQEMMYVCVYVCMYVCMYVCYVMYISMYECVCMYVCIYVYICIFPANTWTYSCLLELYLTVRLGWPASTWETPVRIVAAAASISKGPWRMPIVAAVVVVVVVVVVSSSGGK